MTSPQFNLYLHELPAKILDGDAERLCRQGLPFKVGGLKRFTPHWTRLNHDPFIENVVLTQTITHFTTKPRILTEEVKLEITLHGKPEKYEDGVNYGPKQPGFTTQQIGNMVARPVQHARASRLPTSSSLQPRLEAFVDQTIRVLS